MVKHPPPPRLRHPVAARLQHSKRALVAHPHQAPQRQLEDHAPLERHKVPNVLQQKEAGAIEVAVAQVGDNQGVLEAGVLSRVEAVHAAEALAGGAAG